MARLLFALMVLSLITIVLNVVALVGIARARMEPSARALWVLIVLLIPIVGAILWWTIGRRDVQIAS